MADVLIWTTYVIAAVVVVFYGLAACFVAFLRYALAFHTTSSNGNSLDRVLHHGSLHGIECPVQPILLKLITPAAWQLRCRDKRGV